MRRVSLSFEHIRVGEPLAFAVWDANGLMVAGRGHVLASQREYDVMLSKRNDLFVDALEYHRFKEAFERRLNQMVNSNQSLDKINSAKLTDMGALLLKDGRVSTGFNQTGGAGRALVTSAQFSQAAATAPVLETHVDWLDLIDEANNTLQADTAEVFGRQLERLYARVVQQSNSGSDSALLMLVFLSSKSPEQYSATHALLVAFICHIAARDVLKWSDAQQATLVRAALTMNISMLKLQDRLAQTEGRPSIAQRKEIAQHAVRSAEKLRALGVSDADWLETVRNHHTAAAKPFSTCSPAQAMARLIQRVDTCTAGLAPRRSRKARQTSAALKSTYFNEASQADEAGVAIIKAIGAYPPGSFVRLANHEIGVVIRRGSNVSMPRVAVFLSSDGQATSVLKTRESSLSEYRIVEGLAATDQKTGVKLDQLLKLSRIANATLGE
ncbi:hypothetical protein LBMAG30_29120 [Comamonadaceae bacterium]|nr:hypothetical protein LBMAG30_29120 [Comamonadaceae bacterium]